MVSIKEAAASAIVFAREALGPERTTGVRLEEVESTKVRGQDAWLITLSMIIPSAGSIVAALSGTGRREYKSFTVLKSNGEVKSMKIRELADA
jgi:CRISPR/Cas system CSM-associated protein Csm4 (group 5 of RAMP superfamily)